LILFKHKSELNRYINQLKKEGKKIGFVPTMGALHKGHMSLIKSSKLNSDVTVCSIFVNPTQFNDKNDLAKYPRTLENDIILLEQNGCDVLFHPDVNEMYPTDDNREFDFGFLGNTLDGLHRPGHFNGVAQIVSKLFDAVEPNLAFFGQKDFQQLLIVKDLVKQLKFPVEIISCPISREDDGLAMSSRNQLLTTDERLAASRIPKLLELAVSLFNQGENLEKINNTIIEEVKKEKLYRLDYFEARNPNNLQSINESNKEVVFLIALFCGKIRLIDNVLVSKSN
jgi:pantoate--beta-alanine ligase